MVSKTLRNWMWRSSSGRYSLQLSDRSIALLLRWCRRSDNLETGGILVGFYTATLDCAVVTAVRPPTRDSRRGMTWFKRGTAGVQDWLERTWNKEGHYYLGEWHYHPDATPSPSVIDRAQMRRIAHDPAYHCPEPVLLIIGGIADQFNLRTQAALFVFPAGEHVVPLILDERE